jgi:hypothetical protein
MRSRIVSIIPNEAGATARVVVDFAGSSDNRDIRLKLVRTRAGWRIDDVGTKAEPSLLNDLLKANHKARRH